MNASIYTLITLPYAKIFVDKEKIMDSVIQVVQRCSSTEFKWSSISRTSLATHSHFAVFSFHKASSKAISEPCSADVETGLLRKYLEHMELAEHQWLQKLYFKWDVTFHVNLLIYKLPTTRKKNSLAFLKKYFHSANLSLSLTDIQGEGLLEFQTSKQYQEQNDFTFTSTSL